MKLKSLANWLKGTLVALGICGLAIYIYAIPLLGRQLMAEQMNQNIQLPWMIFLWGSAIPCFAMLGFGWMIAINIGKDNAFSKANAHWLRMISIMAIIDAAIFFVGNMVLLVCKMNYPSLMLGSLLIIFAGTVVAVITAALSNLIAKAAKLKEENDLTI